MALSYDQSVIQAVAFVITLLLGFMAFPYSFSFGA